MHALFQKLTALNAAMFLAVPPGACCVDLGSASHQAAAGRSCCRPAETLVSHSSHRELPTAPQAQECCCRYDALRGDDSPAAAVGWAIPAGSFSFDAEARLSEACGITPAPEEFAPGPRRHLVLCVWLC